MPGQRKQQSRKAVRQAKRDAKRYGPVAKVEAKLKRAQEIFEWSGEGYDQTKIMVDYIHRTGTNDSVYGNRDGVVKDVLAPIVDDIDTISCIIKGMPEEGYKEMVNDAIEEAKSEGRFLTPEQLEELVEKHKGEEKKPEPEPITLDPKWYCGKVVRYTEKYPEPEDTVMVTYTLASKPGVEGMQFGSPRQVNEELAEIAKTEEINVSGVLFGLPEVRFREISEEIGVIQ